MANQFPLQGARGLGSTSYVTDADGNIAQHVEYIPYGEVFVEERNSQFSTNFLFNAKELDNETGLYYYGARYLDPTGAMWLSVDPMWEKYIDANPYNYCHGNPINMTDPTGMFEVKQYSDEELGNLNLTREEYSKFNTLAKNLSNMLDKETVKGLENITGRYGKVQEDFSPGENSPLIEITPGSGAEADHYGNIKIGSDLIKDWLNSDDKYLKSGKNYTAFAEKTFMMALLIIHEYAHWGDRRSNNGWITGQFPEGQVMQGLENVKGYSLWGWDSDSIKDGIQGKSYSGHRGTDATTLFGGKNKNGKYNVLDVVSNQDTDKLKWQVNPSNSNPWLQKKPGEKTKILKTLGF